MSSFRFGSLLLAVALVGCYHHRTITIAPASVLLPEPSRPLVDTPPPALVPMPPTPELKPGTGFTLTIVPPHILTASVAAPVIADSSSLSGPQTAEPALGATTAPASASLFDTDPNSLVGLSEADATRRFGLPATHIETPPARVWTYHSATCDLRLFFYPQVGGTTYRTLTYEIDDHDPADTTRRGCVGGLLKNHAG